MRTNRASVAIDIKRSMVAMIRGSVGSTTYRHSYLIRHHRTIDAVRGGELACAHFVVTVLLRFGLVREGHITVRGLLADMRRFGWKRISRPRAGCVVVWNPTAIHQHAHIGFTLSSQQAVSMSSRTRSPINHALANRPIDSYWWHPRLDRSL